MTDQSSSAPSRSDEDHPGRTRGGRRFLRRAERIGPWLTTVLLSAWAAGGSPLWLGAAAVCLTPALLAVARGSRSFRSGFVRAGLVLLLVAVPAAFGTHLRLATLSGDWEEYWSAREEAVFDRLTEALEDLVDRGDAAVADLVAAAGAEDGFPSPDDLAAIRRAHGLPAIALYGADGTPLVWDGSHRGRVPEEVQSGADHYQYGDTPLFGYLYFTEPVPGTGATAVAAALLRSDLPAGLGAEMGDFASTFGGRAGEDIVITRPDRVSGGEAGGRAVFDFVWPTGEDRRTLFSVGVVRPLERERRASLERRGVRIVTGLLLAAWILLAVGGRGDRRSVRSAVASLAGLALLLPLDALPSLSPDAPSRLAPVDFLLPGPWDVTLARLLLLLLAGTAAAALLRADRGGPFRARATGLAVALLFPFGAWLLASGAGAAFLAGPETGWVAFQLALSVLLSLAGGIVLALGPAPAPSGGAGAESGRGRDAREDGASNRSSSLVVGRGTGLLLGGLAAAAVLSMAGAAVVRLVGELPVLAVAAWGGPAWILARGLSGRRGWRRSVLAWTAATVLGTTAALPVAWGARTEARRVVAAEQMERLAADVDPYLDFLLHRVGRTVRELYRSGAGPVEVLYRAWIESELAREEYPIWLTFWSPGGLPQEELRVGVDAVRPGVATDFAGMDRLSTEVEVFRFQLPDVHYLLVAPLEGGAVVTGVVPPRKEVGPASPLGPLLGSLAGTDSPLTLVPLLLDDPAGQTGELTWVRTARGWQGERLLEYPDQRYHAHYLVDLPGPPVLLARGTLLLVLNLAVVLLVWAITRLVLLGAWPRTAEVRPLVLSFRGRVTLALFGFFLLSNAIFGTLAYRTISGAAERAASVLAQRVVQDAAGVYNEVGGQMELLARQVGTELLEYRDGELRDGSSEELVELGLFEGWLPYHVARSMADREEILAQREERLGRWEYVNAFRRLPDDDVLAAPVPLQAGATAVRREEVAHLLGFAVVAGALLSLTLALLVGRALTRPIHDLQVASERVGAGNLGVRLPADRGDEFGSVFSAFNRMVRRLRRARRDLVRTTRRTQAIVEDAATGVVAFDAAGRVTLANHRAAELLAREVEVGRPLMETGGEPDELVHWVDLYFRDGLREAGGEFQFGERRVRVRARRISREGPLGGAVMSLEDVTDELRTERILAWGEMARQVAHEVKNPLTPIKLSIQHIRRAWDDRRPDFGEILTRNASAALAEIDRLATIATSFSRFGAPEAAGEGPLMPVSVPAVVDEVLALYVTGEGGVDFLQEVDEDVPPVAARTSEMKEVLVNLLENARAAVSSRGTVRIESERRGGRVLLRVVDDGTGIEPGLLPRVFEPHFSTRSAGTGLGLAIVKRLVESWDGAVTVDSEPGEGTIVTVRLVPWKERDDAPFPGKEGSQEPLSGRDPG